MSTTHLRRLGRVPTLLIVPVLAALGMPGGADAALYIKFAGVDGDSTQAGHEDWSDISTVDWGMQVIPGGSGPEVEFSDLEWTQYVDSSFPTVADRMWKQIATETVDIDFTAPFGEGLEETYFSMHFENVQFTELRVSGDTASAVPAAELFGAFNYGLIKVTYTEFDPDGQPLGSREAQFDLEDGSGAPAEVALLFSEGIAGPTVVPLPAGAWLLVSGLLALGGRRIAGRRRR